MVVLVSFNTYKITDCRNLYNSEVLASSIFSVSFALFKMGLIRFIVYGNILISLSAGLLSYGLVTFLNIDDSHYYFLSVFFATLFIYNFQRVPRLDEVTDQYSDRHIWLKKNKISLYFLISLGVSGSAISYFFLLKIHNDFPFLLIIGAIGILYALKLINGNALRDFPYIKIHLIALTWVLVIAVWPLIRMDLLFINHVELLIALYLVMLAITIPFDIRDLNYDDLKKKTLPQLLGIRTSKVLASVFLTIGYLLLIFYDTGLCRNPIYFISFGGFLFLIIQTTKTRKEMFFSAAIDGWILFLGIMFLFAGSF